MVQNCWKGEIIKALFTYPNINIFLHHVCSMKKKCSGPLSFFPFFLFSISHSNVIHREICVKVFSGTTAPRILKFDINYGYDLLLGVRENQPPDASHFLYLSIFLSLQSKLLLRISRLLWEPESSNFLYTLRVAKHIMGQKTKMWYSFLPSFTIFPFFYLSL